MQRWRPERPSPSSLCSFSLKLWYSSERCHRHAKCLWKLFAFSTIHAHLCTLASQSNSKQLYFHSRVNRCRVELSPMESWQGRVILNKLNAFFSSLNLRQVTMTSRNAVSQMYVVPFLQSIDDWLWKVSMEMNGWRIQRSWCLPEV